MESRIRLVFAFDCFPAAAAIHGIVQTDRNVEAHESLGRVRSGPPFLSGISKIDVISNNASADDAQ